MISHRIVCIDTGSTWTKGALFELGQSPRVLKRHCTPTTQHDLYESYSAVRHALGHEHQALVTSSAHGGLRIAAIGIVPELTLQAARLTAMSAGAKIVRHYAWKLTEADIADLETVAPDIVLFTGGTDGGNESYNPANAEAIAASALRAPIVYAGNRSIADHISRILSSREVVVAGNVMPEVNRLDPEPARNAIREVFLRRIIEGKGLERIARDAASPIKPTPLAVFELVHALARRDPGHTFCLADPGGATTDIYSAGPAHSDNGAILRGLPPPRLMRTVEGDIGMRVSASSLVDVSADYLDGAISRAGLSRKVFHSHVAHAESEHAFLPDSRDGIACDRLLAAACLRAAFARHAGRFSELFLPDGRRTVQTGKDLRTYRSVILTGGFAAAHGDAALLRSALSPVPCDSDGPALVPRDAVVLLDAEYLVPLVAPLASAHPRDAVHLMQSHLVPPPGEPFEGRRA